MKDRDIKILAIESSCDETAASVVINGRNIISNVINSQIKIHTEYGGVVPEIASRKHMENIVNVVEEALNEAEMNLTDVDAVAVTNGPGLVGALLVGVSFAKTLAWSINKPLIPVNHIEGHICANYPENKNLEPPFVILVISGGHTYLALCSEYGKYEIVGMTRDDAAGEAFDKVARAIGLGYPGGPKVDKLSKSGNPYAYDFPIAHIDDAPFDFSYSGVKSAVLNQLNTAKMNGVEVNKADVAASFQRAIIGSTVPKAIALCKEKNIRKLAIAGGVASNSALREALQSACLREGIEFHSPSPVMCTDNAAMIGAAAYYKYINNEFGGLNLNAVPNLPL